MSCGQDILDDAVQCSTEDCTGRDHWFHIQCTVNVGEDIICLHCKRQMDEESASQADTQFQD